MKKSSILFAITLLVFGSTTGLQSALAASPYLVVSDLDDTIKITDVKNPVDATLNGVASTAVFAGMPELFRDLDKVADLVILTTSPQFLAGNVTMLLAKNGFPASLLIMRNVLVDPDGKAFKMKALERLAKHNPHQKLILIGDDTQRDPELYDRFQAKHPGRVAAIYIRQNTGRKLPTSAQGIFSAFDLAYFENLKGRMSHKDAMKVGHEILRAGASLVIPKFAACPLKGTGKYKGVPALDEMKLQVGTRIKHICEDRASDKHLPL